MSRCDVPGCPNAGDVIVPVGPDTPLLARNEKGELILDEDGEPYFDVSLDDPPPTYVTGRSCREHVAIVKRALQERHQPRRSASRDGRPW